VSEHGIDGVPTAAEVLSDLVEAGLVRATGQLVPLTGGVSCEVWRIGAVDLVEDVRQRNTHGLVVKAPLATLRTPSLWQADTSRGFAEAEALECYGRLTPSSVPRVVWRHPQAPLLVIEAAPQTWQEWREQMLHAEIGSPELGSARLCAIGRHLGSTLSTWHVRTRDVAALPEVLRSGDRLRTLRTDPFHRATALEVPMIGSRLTELAIELERAQTCLVHGDFSPKNVLVNPPGAHALGVWMLDAEVAHVGDPALDVAYFSAHLACKAVARPELAEPLNLARQAFEKAYRAESSLVDARRWNDHTGAILAARIRGVSRGSYLSEEAESFVLAEACQLVGGQGTLDETWDSIARRASGSA